MVHTQSELEERLRGVSPRARRRYLSILKEHGRIEDGVTLRGVPAGRTTPATGQRKYRWGDAVEKALSMVGVTQERVAVLLGTCGCKRRKEALNRLGAWAHRVLKGLLLVGDDNIESVISQEQCDGQ